MTNTTENTTPTTALVTKGRGKAVHAGVWDTCRGWVTLCNGWGAVDARSSAVREARHAEAVTCKTCLKHQAAAAERAAQRAAQLEAEAAELQAAAEAHVHDVAPSGACRVCFERPEVEAPAASAGRAVIIPCSGAKAEHPAPAGDLYLGSWHRLARAAADALVAREGGRVLILSALHGVVQLGDQLEPYDWTMRDVQTKARHDGTAAGRTPEGEARMAQRVRAQLEALGVTEVVGLVPGAYDRVLYAATSGRMPYARPLLGCSGVGYQRQRLAQVRDGGPAAAAA